MGVTISNHKHSIDLGYGGYLRLRVTVAKLLGCEEFANLYSEFLNPYHACINHGFSKLNDYYDYHDKRANELIEKHNLDENILDFLYGSDCGGNYSVKICRHLWKLIKDYDDDIVYGYYGRANPAMFKDFKQIVQECATDRRVMRTY